MLTRRAFESNPHNQSYHILTINKQRCFVLQVSEIVSWHKPQCCYSFNMMQHEVGARGLIYFCKVDHSRTAEYPQIFPGIDLVSIIYVRYCRYITKMNIYLGEPSLYGFSRRSLKQFLQLTGFRYARDPWTANNEATLKLQQFQLLYSKYK